MQYAIKATIKKIIVAFLIVIVFFGLINIFLGQQINLNISLINKMAIDKSAKKEEIMAIDTTTNKIQNYPEYGTQYATIEIPKIDVNLPVYFGSTLDVLKNGVGHDSASYFPGEGGSIIYMGHNSKNAFRRFSELKKGDEITVKTSYGDFTYKIYDMKLIEETDLDALPIQKDEEILMCYTCYPFNNIGYATQRYVVYAKPI